MSMLKEPAVEEQTAPAPADAAEAVEAAEAPVEVEEAAEPVPPLKRNRDFRLLWLGAGVSQFGGRLSAVAYPMLMVWHGHSVTQAGLVAFAAQLPNLTVQLPAGVLVDRFDRRRLMIACDLAALVAMAALVTSLVLGAVWVPLVMAAAFVEGSAAIFYRLAERAAVRNVVHPDHLSAALSQNESRGHAAGLLGNPVSSALFTVLPWLPFALSGLGRIGAYLGLVAIRTEFQQPRRPDRPRDLRAEIAEGFNWLRGQRFMRAAVALVAGTNVLFQIMGLTLVVTVQRAGGSPAVLGAIGVVSGLGGVLGALSGSWWMKRFSPAAIMTVSFALWAVLMASVAFTANPFALAGLYAGMSGVGAAMNVTAGVYQARICPDELQGRAASFAVLASSGANSLGALSAGFLLAALGPAHTALGAGAVMALIVLLALASPAVRSGREVIG
ncbi:putative MFS family arabinose efflux permease [Kitasatospora cineracea]|uniref:Putative MFS family arabinose efflux permease n=2 Tax=Kitasatospora cineracea TaxID=88074 RepID=A0A8G1UEM6_9ACTN|nr:putative MFS family arabinose efflux permease [Kitasatospora cineracea]